MAVRLADADDDVFALCLAGSAADLWPMLDAPYGHRSDYRSLRHHCRLHPRRHRAPTGTMLCLFDFSDAWRNLPSSFARAQGAALLHDALSDQPVLAHEGGIALPPQARVWLT